MRDPRNEREAHAALAATPRRDRAPVRDDADRAARSLGVYVLGFAVVLATLPPLAALVDAVAFVLFRG